VTRRPLIAISAVRETMLTGFGELDCTRLTAAYTDVIYSAGGRPVILPVVDPAPPGLLDGMDGLILSGGGDIDPQHYGQPTDPAVTGIRRDRDAFEIALYNEAVDKGLPILAICRGAQLVNIVCGGTLTQHVDGHWQTEPPQVASHAVDVLADSALSDAVGRSATLPVNSFHHQGLDRIGAGLRVTAVSGGGVEAVESADRSVVAVQWHPELMAAAGDPQHYALFERFVQNAAGRLR